MFGQDNLYKNYLSQIYTKINWMILEKMCLSYVARIGVDENYEKESG